ncbi:hypothetical protein BT96DRAFT_842818 [Gymnopus androsaceus JB14]|uniref:Protein kinase domain-containing protein n=1 Tax=Gymnopus androsaceus JB14 TaxID=1447944 RepID=A0A6A4GF69_9AGAR|nr:hypothetical protein BT96DRAFT_842818 [Gymnopus androsaceus JB14]
MESEPETHTIIPQEVLKTPTKPTIASDKRAYGPPIINSTPAAKHAGSHAEDKVSQTVSVVNEFLEDDLAQRKVLSMEEFATIILNLPEDWKVKPAGKLGKEVEEFNKTFGAYLAEIQKPGHERRLYEPLARLLNSVPRPKNSKVASEDEKVFYVQDPRTVLGSLIKRRPDLGAVYLQLLNLSKREDLAEWLEKHEVEGVFWGLLLYFVEVKDDNGHCLAERCDESCCPQRVNVGQAPASSNIEASSSSGSSALRSNDLDPSPFAVPAFSLEKKAKGKAKTIEVAPTESKEKDNEIEEERKLPPVQKREHTRKQAGSYAREMFAHGVPRTHVIGITIDDRLARMHYYDHSKVIESPVFHIDLEFKQLFLAMICQLQQLDQTQLGVIPGLEAPFLRNHAKLSLPSNFWTTYPPSADILVGSLYTFKYRNGRRTVIIKRILFTTKGLNGRGTWVAEIECFCGAGKCTWTGEDEWHGKKLIMKISFPSARREAEDKIIINARERAESSDDQKWKWVLNHLPLVVHSFDTEFNEDSIPGRLRTHLQGDYEERVIRVTIQEKLHPITELEDPVELAQVFYDIVQVHEWLYKYARVLHRDLSETNLMFRRIDGKVYGVLNDFDLSSSVDRQNDGPSSNHRTGTKPFMAIDLLDEKWHGGHMYRHDLESLFYIMLCVACRYEKPAKPLPKAPYEEWFGATDRLVYLSKVDLIHTGSEESLPIKHFFRHFNEWLEIIYGWLHLGYKGRPAIRSRWVQDEDKNFDWETLGEKVTYPKMKALMSLFAGKPLETRCGD